ncbi:MAG TPA: hypothetical protein VHV83_07125 [Armatimonadota bacterium]|nr:hypothetical protein [Armatimonadota bacterium]
MPNYPNIGRVVIDDSPTVSAVFTGGEVTPKAFTFKGTAHTVATVNHRWTGYDQRNNANLRYMSVTTTEGVVFKLQFNCSTLGWMVERMG